MNENEKTISAKEERFCLEYAVDYNGTQAAIRAGYSEKSAGKIANRLLKRVGVMERVRQLQKEQAERLCLSSDLLLLRLMETLDKCNAVVPVMEWNYEEHQMMATGEYTFDSRGAVKCLELIGKYLGAFDRKNNDDAPAAVFIHDDLEETDDDA